MLKHNKIAAIQPAFSAILALILPGCLTQSHSFAPSGSADPPGNMGAVAGTITGSATNTGAASADTTGPVTSATPSTFPTTAVGTPYDPDVYHLPYDANGWTIYPTDYEVTIYVDSASGNDANWTAASLTSGNTMTTAIKTIPKLQSIMGLSQLSSRSVRVILKRGSSWPNDTLTVPRGGLTADHPLLITGSIWYDQPTDPRPMIGVGIRVWTGVENHVVLDGIEVGDPNSTVREKNDEAGIIFNQAGGHDYLVEDCRITRFWHGIEFNGNSTGSINNIRLRRSQLLYATGPYGSAAVGLSGASILGLAVDENLFDLNGVPPTITYNGTAQDGVTVENSAAHEAAVGDMPDYTNPQAHDVYFTTINSGAAVNAIFRGNMFSRTMMSQKGISTGTMDGNLFYEAQSGGFISPHRPRFTNNALIHAGGAFMISDDNASFENTDSAAIDLFFNNLFYDFSGQAVALGSDSLNKVGGSIDLDQNIVDGAATGFADSDPSCNRVIIRNNYFNATQLLYFHPLNCPLTVSNNQYFAPGTTASNKDFYYTPIDYAEFWFNFAQAETQFNATGDQLLTAALTFPDPTRDISSYMSTEVQGLGNTPTTLLGFLSLWAKQSKLNWNPTLAIPALVSYIRAGHGMTEQDPGAALSSEQ